MITIHPYEKLGRRDYGWLDARYHFSFGDYHDPARMGFGALRVINDDIVKAGTGFDTHPHKDMEIITYVRRGAITHRDSLGNEGRTAEGDVQVMSAGTGILHSEHNRETIDTNLYQIWIVPREKGVTPRWDSRRFPHESVNDRLPLLVSGRARDADSGALFIHQDAAIYGGRLAAGKAVNHAVSGKAYILVAEGQAIVNGHVLKKGDGAAIEGRPGDTETIAVSAKPDAEIIVIDLP